jgi:hypothetical protein
MRAAWSFAWPLLTLIGLAVANPRLGSILPKSKRHLASLKIRLSNGQDDKNVDHLTLENVCLEDDIKAEEETHPLSDFYAGAKLRFRGKESRSADWES